MSLLKAVVGPVDLEVRVELKYNSVLQLNYNSIATHSFGEKNTSLRAGIFHYKVVYLKLRFPQQALHQSCWSCLVG
jgi:hypothetical protein